MRAALYSIYLAVIVVLLSGCDIRREYDAALVLGDIAAGTKESRLKATTPQPARRAVALPGPGTTRTADLYLTSDKPLAGLLLLPGAAEGGKDDPRLVALAVTMARARFAVLVPDMVGFRSLQVGSSDIGETARVFAWLSSHRDLAPEGRAGIFSLSYASGPALLAALEPPAAGRVSFLMSIGGYHSVKDVLVFFTTGYFRLDGEWRFLQPNSYGKWVFVQSNIGRITSRNDRLLFQQIAQRKLENLDAPVDDLAARLGPEGRSLYDFIENRDPREAPALMDRLPLPIRREIDDLNVAARDLSRLKARLILVHGYDDDIIPYTESIALSRQLPPGQARLYLVHGLKHVTLGHHMLSDSYRLWRSISALLAERG
ncbi:alpha/beta hydrolase [Geomonas sp. RF6]|uniref:alpha/beta hydrolase n=1 Tax=Geomonas sp. RF6 TaxID=2897342 RepID=UPI001E3E559E|nr:alpha/beta hydrolase [Geomonas sp. RF6]UFS69579.1 alpha/beta hydrolase [Geomonas sp. RF6]